MKNHSNLLTSKLDSRVCIIGNNAKSVAAAMALTHFGFSVTLYAFSGTAEKHLEKYQFDKPLCEQWEKSLTDGSLDYQLYTEEGIQQSEHGLYWAFLDQLDSSLLTELVASLSKKEGDICFSGVVPIGTIDRLASQFVSSNVFYIPFVFLNEASVFVATIAPKLFLVGEKVPGSALKNPIIEAFVDKSGDYYIHNLKTVEFARSSMMNLMAIKLSLLNEMAQLADECSVDMLEVEKMLKLDKRLGHGGLQAGWGYGGSTLPKENAILKSHLSDLKISTNIIDAVEQINNNQKEVIFQKLWRHFNSNISNKVIVIWGAGYKSGTGRTKGSAIHTLLPLLWAYDITTFIFDPLAESEMDRLYDGDERLHFISNPYEKFDVADGLIVINWSEQSRPDVTIINQQMTPVFDARNLFKKSEILALKGYYTGIGRGVR